YMSRAPGGMRLRWGSPESFPIGVLNWNDWIERVTQAVTDWDAAEIPQGGPEPVSTLIQLGRDEYFVCGDNSPISGDARYWNDPINLPLERLQVEAGRVPGRFLLGKAFFVYWPAGFRPIDSAPALVPNFGQM